MTDGAAAWRTALAAAAARARHLREVEVLETVGSTQDAALDRRPGAVVAALRQTAGRGRRGKQWIDDGGAGVALTAVVDADAQDAPWGRLALLGAIAAAETVERAVGRPAAIKWPNDVLLGTGKVAGVLVERRGATARIGIGINVGCRQWPHDLAAHATALADHAPAPPARAEVAAMLLERLDAALDADVDDLVAAFARRDALAGRPVRLLHEGASIEATVRTIDPLVAVHVELDDGALRVLPVATTTVISWR